MNRLALRPFGVQCWWLGVLVFLTACEGHHPHQTTVQETIAAHEDVMADTSVDLGAANMPKVAVKLGPTDIGTAYFTESRVDKLAQYPCSQCHAFPLEPQPNQVAHWDRTLNHAPSDMMSCTSCHSADQKMEQLHLLSGQTLDFDHVYQLCGQCHFEQLRDWRGGAHGKRLLGWAGERVISNCTSCHDPHRPGFDKRFPSFSPTPPESKLLEAPLEGETHEH